MKENFEALKEKYEAIPADEVISPSIPIDVFVDEAIDLHYTAQTDAAKLAVAGVTSEMIHELLIGGNSLRYLESIWMHEHTVSTDGQKHWKEQSREAYELRSEILHHCRFVFRKDDMKMKVIREISKGGTNADLVQDLSDLVYFCEDNKEALAAVGFGEEKITRMKQLLVFCSEFMGLAHEDTKVKRPSMLMRNRAFTYLKGLVDEVRVAGKYVFWRNSDRIGLYASEYARKHRKKDAAAEEGVS